MKKEYYYIAAILLVIIGVVLFILYRQREVDSVKALARKNREWQAKLKDIIDRMDTMSTSEETKLKDNGLYEMALNTKTKFEKGLANNTYKSWEDYVEKQVAYTVNTEFGIGSYAKL